MSERNPIDDLFRDKLYNHSLEAPMHLWSALDARNVALARQAQRRRLLWYLSGAVLLLCLLSAGIWMWTGQVDRKPEPRIQTITQIDPAIAAQKPARDVQEALKRERETPDHGRNAVNSSGLESITSATQIENHKKAGERNRFEANNASYASAQKLKNNLPTAEIKEKSIIAATHSNFDAAGFKEDASTLNNAVVERNNELGAKEEGNGNLKEFAYLNVRDVLVDYERDLGLDGTKPLYYPRKRGWRVYGEFLAGADVPQRSLSAREPEFELYRQAREQSESVNNGYRGSLRFSMISVDGIAVRSGLSYSNHQESFTYQQNTQNNNFQTIDIPLIVGYERNNVGKFTFSANAGAYLNMAFYQKGNFLSPDLNQVLDFSSKTPDAYPAFRNSLGIALFGSVAASYPITPSLRLVVEPYVLHYPGSFTASDYAIDQRYQNWGIQIGLRKKINKYIYFARP